MDGRNLAPPKTPWNEAFPRVVPTNVLLLAMVSFRGAKWISPPSTYLDRPVAAFFSHCWLLGYSGWNKAVATGDPHASVASSVALHDPRKGKRIGQRGCGARRSRGQSQVPEGFGS